MFTITSIPEPTVVLDPWERDLLAKCPSYVKTITPSALLERLANVPLYAVDSETTGLNRAKDHILFWSMSDGIDRWSLTRAQLPLFKNFLEDQSKEQVYANANYDAAMFYNSGVDVVRNGRKRFRRWDVIVMHALLVDNQSHSLKDIAHSILNVKMLPFKKVFEVLGAKSENDPGRQLVKFYETDPYRVINYQTLDSWTTFRAREELATRMSECVSSSGMDLLLYYIGMEMPMHEVLLMMEREGIHINEEKMQALRKRLQDELEITFRDLTQILGKVINPKSPQQLRELFYTQDENGVWTDIDGNAPMKLTKGGKSGIKLPSTDSEVLKTLTESDDPRAAALGRFRKRSTALQYLDKYEEFKVNGRVHTSLNQAAAATGRLSSSDPPLQNVSKDNDDFQIREIFEPPPGMKLGDADQAQLEMRIVASQSGDRALREAILAGKDLHSWTAHRMFQQPYEVIMEAVEAKEAHAALSAAQKELVKLRGSSKTINFGVISGETAFKLSKQLKCSLEHAEDLLERYWASYPELRVFFSWVRDFVNENGFIETPLGRRRWIHQSRVRGLSDRDYERGMRQAGNHPIQGHASELIKGAQIRIYCDEDFWAAGHRQILQVHDELITYAPPPLFDDPEFVARFEHYMSFPFGDTEAPLSVPLVAKLHSGWNWSEAK